MQVSENHSAFSILCSLCRAFNVCFLEMKVKYTHSAMPFKQMENIATFLHALSKLPNFRSFDLFSTVDLYEGKNMTNVTRCILSCKRIAEKEALVRGIEKMDIEEKHEIVEEEQQPENVILVEEAADIQVEKVESFEEIKATEQSEEQSMEQFEEQSMEQSEEQSMEQSEEFEVVEKEASTAHLNEEIETIEPEIILIDSPVFADDESGPIIREDGGEGKEKFEEYETFTLENPGTF